MRVASVVVSASALAGSVLGDGNTIRNAMKTIGRDTAALGDAVSSWSGDLLGALPIVGKAGGLLVALKHGAHTADVSTPLSFDEALTVATATGDLASTVNKTLDALVSARPKFDHLFVTPLILITLDVQRGASNDFSSKVVGKVPKELQSIARQLIKGIDDNFGAAIDAYH
ncbi:hydrophobic surface binding protein A domain-containing protein [Hirsutella rhossiliensis]|uniref:Hydrophobic surface binding protein A domain-containing protein n=1 Tax=Hirsutella rhossiliensis TaxID=111463 RepID=A0A9P8SHD1_9HYPO|nr:hydrophobic surface binding protein A domain-containing protein [Hirsutella rhossiliensis]KAH0962716.1 hydrophobic surface binding protein A domain-containing protein [Hirsutella rhossiliensis]